MKTHNIDDAQLQAAIDEAFRKSERLELSTLSTLTAEHEAQWGREAPARLALAKDFLARLPEPTPPVVDGKTPGQVYQEVLHALDPDRFYVWNEIRPTLQKEIEQAASAVLAAFGGQARGPINLEAAVGATPGSFAKVCDDPKTGELPMSEIPWIEWHGGECPLEDNEVEKWEYRVRGGQIYNWNPPSERFWKHDGCSTNIIAYRVLKWREGCGPDAVDWKAKYEATDFELGEYKVIAEHGVRQSGEWKARAEKAEAIAAKWEREATLQLTRAEKAEAELAQWKNDHAFQVQQWQEMRNAKVKVEDELARVVAAAHEAGWNGVDNPKDLAQFIKRQAEELAHSRECNAQLTKACLGWQTQIREMKAHPSLSRLRPIAEAGPVPEGAVRVYAHETRGGWSYYDWLAVCTHFADIYPPEASQPAVEAEQVWADQACKALVEHAEQAAKPEPTTFEVHGKTWTRHKPGDPMPCDADKRINWIFRDGVIGCTDDAINIGWERNENKVTDIVGWRYADEQTPELPSFRRDYPKPKEPTPEPAQPWTPAVGNVVTLKSGGDKLTVSGYNKDVDEWNCVGFSGGCPSFIRVPAATLQPA